LGWFSRGQRRGGSRRPRPQVERVDLGVLAGLRGLDDLAAAQVHHYVTGVGVGAGREQQVAGWMLVSGTCGPSRRHWKVVRAMCMAADA